MCRTGRARGVERAGPDAEACRPEVPHGSLADPEPGRPSAHWPSCSTVQTPETASRTLALSCSLPVKDNTAVGVGVAAGDNDQEAPAGLLSRKGLIDDHVGHSRCGRDAARTDGEGQWGPTPHRSLPPAGGAWSSHTAEARSGMLWIRPRSERSWHYGFTGGNSTDRPWPALRR